MTFGYAAQLVASPRNLRRLDLETINRRTVRAAYNWQC